jgi:hypothetical protein
MPRGKSREELIKVSKKFSSEYQPKRRRTAAVKLSDILQMELEKPKEIRVYGIDPVTHKEASLIIKIPTKEILIQVLTNKAAKGDMRAMEIILDRHDGKVPMPLQMSGQLELSAKSRQELSRIEDLDIEDAEFTE